jgi:hypothetical protein
MSRYPTPRNLSKSQKAPFLLKRISDAETLAEKSLTLVEKNYPLFECRGGRRQPITQFPPVLIALPC